MLDTDELATYIATNGPWLYHATPSENLEAILRDGLRPGSELGRTNAPNPFHLTRAGHVYLWTAEHHHELRRDVGDATLRVELQRLNPALIDPDEDLVQINWLHSAPGQKWVEAQPPFRGPYPDQEGALAHWADTTPGFDAPAVTAQSLRAGRIAYRGTIPPNAITVSTCPPG